MFVKAAALLLVASLAVASGQTGGKTANTYMASSAVAGTAGATAADADACAALCSGNKDCMYWAFCPADVSAGCTVPGVAGSASTTVAAGGCVLTYDNTAGASALFMVSGSSVLFTSGGKSTSNTRDPAITAVDPNNPASFVDPNGVPEECSDFLMGEVWAGDAIRCRVCGNDYILECDMDTDLLSDNSVNCEFDANGAIDSALFNAKEFECSIDYGKTPQNQCNWADLEATLPECAREPVKRIMASWKPDE